MPISKLMLFSLCEQMFATSQHFFRIKSCRPQKGGTVQSSEVCIYKAQLTAESMMTLPMLVLLLPALVAGRAGKKGRFPVMGWNT